MSIINNLKLVRTFKKEVLMSKNELQLRQQEKFRKLLKHAYKNSLFYRNYYTEHGIKKKDLDDINIKDIPIINKTILMDNFNDIVCDKRLNKNKLEEYVKNLENIGKKYLNKYLVIHTSGSGGQIGIFVYSKNELDTISVFNYARRGLTLKPNSPAKSNPPAEPDVSLESKTPVKARPSVKSKRSRKRRLSFIGAVEGNFAAISSMRYFTNRKLVKMFTEFLPVSINLSLNEIVEKLNHFQPHFLNGYSSGIYLLALEQLKGNLNIHPVRIVGGGDQLTDEMQKIIKKAFSIDPVNVYSAAESFLGEQKYSTSDMILFSNLNIFEIVDENNNDVPEGETGKLILTPLYKFTQPLIRYETNDHLQLSSMGDDKLGFQRIKRVAGRNEEILWFKGKNNETLFLHPLALVDFFVPGLERMQFIQTGKTSILLKVEIGNNNDKEVVTADIYKKMSEILKINKLTDIVTFKVEVVDLIPNDPGTGKYRLVIPFSN